MVAWVLSGVLPGYTWCYLECYLECYLVLPGRYLGCYFKSFFVAQNIRVPQTQTFEKENFHLEMLPGPAPVLVTWLPGPPSVLNVICIHPPPVLPSAHIPFAQTQINDALRRRTHAICRKRDDNLSERQL